MQIAKAAQSVTIALLSCLMLSCEKSDLAMVDIQTDVPFLSNATCSPDSIYIDSITPANGLYPISATVTVQIASSRDIQNVSAVVIRPGTPAEIHRTSLRDNGVPPDVAAGDGRFTGSLSFNIQRTFAGNFRVRFSAESSGGTTSNAVEKPLRLTRRNSAPVLSNLNAPDTLQRPTSGSLLFSMTVAAADSDGLQDVREVIFQNLNSSSQSRIPLLDDGGIRQPSGISSGDAAAGDGVFSTLVQLPDTVSPRTFLFKFQATDSFGDTSASILHNLTIR